MNAAAFQEALNVISDNKGSNSIIEIGYAQDTQVNTLTLIDCNAFVTQRLVKQGFSLYVTAKGVLVDNFNL